MSDLPSPASAEDLLTHADWVRALARTLVRDPAGADDVAQASFLVALEHPPRDTHNLRRWLSQIVRNSAGQGARSEARRDTRERNSARPEALPDTAELVAEAELQREVVGHVFALDEPYRTTVLPRFFRELDAREIAARQHVPLATVRTRLQRAMAQLRERLDRSHGGRASWCAALEWLAGGREATTASLPNSMISGGGALMGMAWRAGAVALVAAATLWIWVRTAHDDDSPSAAQTSSAQGPEPVAALVTAPDGRPCEVPPAEDRSTVPAAASTTESTTPAVLEQELRRVDGRVVDSA